MMNQQVWSQTRWITMGFFLALFFLFSAHHCLAQSCCVDGNSIISTFAGTGNFGNSGNGGPASSADLFPVSGYTDPSGNTYILDTINGVVRKVSPTGTISAFAGNGTSGFGGDSGPATLAELGLELVSSVTGDAAGNIDILDTDNNRIRQVNHVTGTINTLLIFPNMSPGLPEVMTMDGSGNFIVGFFPVSGSGGNYILRVSPLGVPTTLAGTGSAGYSGDGGPAVSAAISNPDALAVDPSGNIYFDDGGNYRIRRIDTGGAITTLVGKGVDGNTGDNGPATQATIHDAQGLAYCGGGLYLSDPFGFIRMVSPAGTITTFAGNGLESDSGDGGPAVSSTISFPGAIWVDSQKSIYVAESSYFYLTLPDPVTLYLGDKVRKISSACVSTVTPTPTITGTPTPTPTASPTPPPCPPGYTGPNPPAPGTSFTFPSPASGNRLSFVYFMKQAGSVRILVRNERGDLAAEITGEKGCGVQLSDLDIGRFAAGVYFYNVRLDYGQGAEENLKTQKFMVLR